MPMGSVAPISESPLSNEELRLMDAWWRAANYLSVGQIYLLDNPLLREPLELKHIKPRLLGHWGTTPGLNFLYVHLNRVIKAHGLNAIYLAGPGHGAPGILANTWLEGTYSEVYPHIPRNALGMQRLFKQFSFPGGIPSHAAPETPGSIHEGRTKSRLLLDPVRAPVIEQIYQWRTVGKLGCPAIAARLNADPATYPPPNPGTGWTAQNVRVMLANPKYTGHMVYGRHRARNGRHPRPDRSVAVVTGPGAPRDHRPGHWDAVQDAAASWYQPDGEEPTATRPRCGSTRTAPGYGAGSAAAG